MSRAFDLHQALGTTLVWVRAVPQIPTQTTSPQFHTVFSTRTRDFAFLFSLSLFFRLETSSHGGYN